MGNKRNPNDLLTVSEVAKRTGVAPSALRYYEELGLITAQRTSGNQRRYHRHMIRRISLIKLAKRFGISLESVGEAFAGLPHDRKPTKAEWERISRAWGAHLAARRREIEQLEAELTGCIGCGCLSTSKCRLLNPDDALAETGSGARLLLAETGDEEH